MNPKDLSLNQIKFVCQKISDSKPDEFFIKHHMNWCLDGDESKYAIDSRDFIRMKFVDEEFVHFSIEFNVSGEPYQSYLYRNLYEFKLTWEEFGIEVLTHLPSWCLFQGFAPQENPKEAEERILKGLKWLEEWESGWLNC